MFKHFMLITNKKSILFYFYNASYSCKGPKLSFIYNLIRISLKENQQFFHYPFLNFFLLFIVCAVNLKLKD
jgi:hypothetical protein